MVGTFRGQCHCVVSPSLDSSSNHPPAPLFSREFSQSESGKATYVGLTRDPQSCSHCSSNAGDPLQRLMHIRHGCPLNMYIVPTFSEMVSMPSNSGSAAESHTASPDGVGLHSSVGSTSVSAGPPQSELAWIPGYYRSSQHSRFPTILSHVRGSRASVSSGPKM